MKHAILDTLLENCEEPDPNWEWFVDTLRAELARRLGQDVADTLKWNYMHRCFMLSATKVANPPTNPDCTHTVTAKFKMHLNNGAMGDELAAIVAKVETFLGSKQVIQEHKPAPAVMVDSRDAPSFIDWMTSKS